MKRTVISLLLLLSILGSAKCQTKEKLKSKESDDSQGKQGPVDLAPLDMNRVRQIALLLPESPRGFGRPYQERAQWDKMHTSGKYDKVIESAQSLLKQELPSWNEKTYNAFYTEGDSNIGKKMLLNRLEWINTLTWAECLENKGAYIPAIEKALSEIVSQTTWTNTRNNINKGNRAASKYNVELSAARYANNLGQCLFLLNDKLNATTIKSVKNALNERIFTPVLNSVQSENNDHWWLTGTNNWNAVCLSQVVGAALSTLEDKTERAKFVAIGERYSKNGLAGFLADGYCSEGVAYYNYGFGNYILLRENIYQSTSGKIDLLDDPKIKKIAKFLPNMEIFNNVYPDISDCALNTKGNKAILFYLNRNLGMGLDRYNTYNPSGNVKDLVGNIMYAFPNTATQKDSWNSGQFQFSPLRSYFDNAGVLTVRPQQEDQMKGLGAVLKGGNNAENHNHNDVGSVTLAIGNEILMGDPGSIPYAADIFGSARYTYKTIASYGHPVPVIADVQQRPGAQSKAIITKSSFTDDEDIFEIDITSAYDVHGLKQATRKFDYSRENYGRLVITDEVHLDSPQSFETAIITRANWSMDGNDRIILKGEKQTLIVFIKSMSGDFSINSEVISEKGTPYTRIAVRSKNKLTDGKFAITYTPQLNSKSK